MAHMAFGRTRGPATRRIGSLRRRPTARPGRCGWQRRRRGVRGRSSPSTRRILLRHHAGLVTLHWAWGAVRAQCASVMPAVTDVAVAADVTTCTDHTPTRIKVTGIAAESMSFAPMTGERNIPSSQPPPTTHRAEERPSRPSQFAAATHAVGRGDSPLDRRDMRTAGHNRFHHVTPVIHSAHHEGIEGRARRRRRAADPR